MAPHLAHQVFNRPSEHASSLDHGHLCSIFPSFWILWTPTTFSGDTLRDCLHQVQPPSSCYHGCSPRQPGSQVDHEWHQHRQLVLHHYLLQSTRNLWCSPITWRPRCYSAPSRACTLTTSSPGQSKSRRSIALSLKVGCPVIPQPISSMW